MTTFDSELTDIIRWLITTQKKTPYAISKTLGKSGNWLNYRLDNNCGFGIIALHDLLAILNEGKLDNSPYTGKSKIMPLYGLTKPQRGKGQGYVDTLPTDKVFKVFLTPNLRAKCRNAGVNYKQINYFINHADTIDIPARHIASLLTNNDIPKNKQDAFFNWLFSVQVEPILMPQVGAYNLRLP